MADEGDAPARSMPVIVAGSATSPTTFVLSIMGSIPARTARRCHWSAASSEV